MNLTSEIIATSDVSHEQRREMYLLMDRYYAGMTEATFYADLSEKHWVIRVVDPSTNVVRGFSTQMLIETAVGDRPVTALFSGDTIVDHRHWGSNSLARAWGRFVLSLIDAGRLGETDLYWFLIVKGYKTYRFLPVFFHEFFPRFDAPTPEWATAILDRLGQLKFPDKFDAKSGVVRAGADAERLRPGVADVTPSRRADPHVRFFESSNPDHLRGDELCCLARLTRDNFTNAARRVIGIQTFSILGSE